MLNGGYNLGTMNIIAAEVQSFWSCRWGRASMKHSLDNCLPCSMWEHSGFYSRIYVP